MKILGIDQSFTSTGWCIYDTDLGDEHIKYGIITSNKNESRFLRAGKVAGELCQVAYQNRVIDKVVIEGLPMGNIKGNVNRDLAGLQAIIYFQLYEHTFEEEDIQIVAPTSLKKFATGSGKAKKEEMFEALDDIVMAKFMSTPKTRGRYDITDAYWLARYGSEV